jgi:hypothetical protein
MATRKSSRSARPKGRAGGNRRTHPTRQPRKDSAKRHSLKPQRKPTLSPSAMKKRLESQGPAPREIGTAAVDALREMRDAGDGPTLPDIGADLRGVVEQLERVESYVIVARMALDGQNAEQDDEVARLLKHDVSGLLFKQIHSLVNIAAKCDGGPRSDREDDDEFDDEDDADDGETQ